ncbi:carbohydrate kinase [Xylophilus sp. Leaf220]|uniref:carbohydrate kinase family protein n=1 Tax=Xylophilus sp. Leaf220 TaxID=1735686 RepID=UPI0006F97D4D|nr:carbohydrate kinase [Xylophilus sp. Leaf220]KQM71318.1 ribokinase [Xylophilus sp. Leaf220]
MRIAFVGEALIDFTGTGGLGFVGHEGGALANSAIAAARLGQPAGLVTQLSTDLFGERLLANLQANGVDTRLVLRSDAPSTLAFVERTPQTNRYAFYTQATADTLWSPDPLPELPQSCRYLHFGSIALLQEPAAGCITALVQAQRGARIVVFDPNVRPSLVRDMAGYRERMRAWAALSDIVKLSDEDATALAPHQDAADTALCFLRMGPRAVVLTRGAAGATLYRTGHAPLEVRPPSVAVVDTIGAGDTFGAALSVGLLEQGVEQPAQLAALADATWRTVLQFAAAAAALNCTREGANPPRRDEVRGTWAGPQDPASIPR